MEQFANEASANLDGGISSSATTVTVKSPANIPASGTFRARVDDEYLKVTAVSGLDWTVERGDGGTTAAPHLDGANVVVIVTKEAVDALVSIQDAGAEVANRRVLNFNGALISDDPGSGRVDISVGKAGTGTSGSQPAAAASGGQIYLPSDGARADVSDGTDWASFGPIFPIARPPLAATWTAVNFGVGDALTDTGPGLNLAAARAASDRFRLAVRSLPAPPYTATAAILYVMPTVNSARVNMCVRDSASGKLIVFGPIWNSKIMLYVTRLNSPTAFASHALASECTWQAPMLWYRIADDGTNRTYQVSPDGANFSTALSEARTTHITPDQVGWGVDVPNGGPFAATLISWKVS